MALLFPRLARNFIKNGYYPTDSVTLDRIVESLKFCGSKTRILDPCCGEGSALSAIQRSLSVDQGQVESYGVEYDRERAWHSKQLLDHCIHGDIHDCMISARSFGLLYLNPPYGDMVSDQANYGSDDNSGRSRFEKVFYRKTHGLLQFGGVMVLVIPFYTLDKELSSWISTHFHDVQVFMAPEQAFKQCVVFGVKHRVASNWVVSAEFKQTRKTLIEIGKGDVVASELPASGARVYEIPDADALGRFETVRLDGTQLADTLGCRQSGLWRDFDRLFCSSLSLEHKRPLCDVSNWHLALLLAAGQISGVVRNQSGRTLVVRGDTYKDKRVTTTTEPGPRNTTSTTITKTDIFVPAIRAVDMTPGSLDFGEVFVIK